MVFCRLQYALVCGAWLLFFACGPKESAPIPDLTPELPFDEDEAVATIDGRSVTVGEFLNAFMYFGSFERISKLATGGNETSYLVDLLSEMEDMRVFGERAREKGYVDPARVEDYVENLRFEKISNLYYIHEIFFKTDVSEKEIRAYYEKMKEDRFTVARRIKIKWIFISREKWGWEEAEKRAEEVESLLDGKQEFEELLYTYSDSTSPQRFMDYGWYKRGDVESNPAFEEAIFALQKIGEHTGPIRARNGFHFGKLTGLREQEVVSYENARLLLRDELIQEKVERKLGELVEEGLETMTIERNFDLLDQPDADDDATLFRVEDYRYPLGRFRTIALARGLSRRSEQQNFLEQVVRNAVIYQLAIEAGYGRLDIEQVYAPLIQRYLAQSYFRNAVENQVEVSEKELLDYYEEHHNEFVSTTQIHPYWILFRANVSSDALRYQKELAMREAKQQADQVYYGFIRKSGEPFTDLARKYSHHEPTKLLGGDLGLYAGGNMGHRFDEVAFGMAEGEISRPVELRNGFCLIWLKQRFPPRPLTYEEVREEIDKALRERKSQKLKQELQEEIREGRDIHSNDELLQQLADYFLRARDDIVLRATLLQ